jgi:glycosyltransferase
MESIIPRTIFIISESNRSTEYGIGTYMKVLEESLNDTPRDIYLLNLFSKANEIEFWNDENLKIINIPKPINERKSSLNEFNKRYYKVIFLFLKLFIKDDHLLIFHFNFFHNIDLIINVKEGFAKSKIIFTVHYFAWSFDLTGNISRFRKTINKQKSESFDDTEKLLLETFHRDREVFNISDHIICISKFSYDLLVNEYKIQSKKISLIYNGIKDINRICLRNDPTINLAYHMDDKVILFVGRIDDSKGISFLFEAYRKIADINSNIKLVVVGDGDIDKYSKYLTGLENNIVFTGKLKKSELCKLYSIANIGVITSFMEHCSYVAIEMMMFGIPVVSTDAAGLNEMFENNKNGLKVKIKQSSDHREIDTNELSFNMYKLLTNSNFANEISKNARNYYLKHYTDVRFKYDLLNLYNTI